MILRMWDEVESKSSSLRRELKIEVCQSEWDVMSQWQIVWNIEIEEKSDGGWNLETVNICYGFYEKVWYVVYCVYWEYS